MRHLIFPTEQEKKNPGVCIPIFFFYCMLTNFVFCAVLRVMTEHCCVFVFSAADSTENETGYQPYINDKEGPRKADLIGDRKCLKKCRNNKDCRGRNKKCMCDDVCGKSCVKPSKLRTAWIWCVCQYQIYQSWHKHSWLLLAKVDCPYETNHCYEKMNQYLHSIEVFPGSIK